MLSFIKNNRNAIGYFVAGISITALSVAYTSYYEDHVETQKGKVLIYEISQDLAEMKDIIKTTNSLINDLSRDNNRIDIQLKYLEREDKRLQNQIDRIYAQMGYK